MRIANVFPAVRNTCAHFMELPELAIGSLLVPCIPSAETDLSRQSVYISRAQVGFRPSHQAHLTSSDSGLNYLERAVSPLGIVPNLLWLRNRKLSF